MGSGGMNSGDWFSLQGILSDPKWRRGRSVSVQILDIAWKETLFRGRVVFGRSTEIGCSSGIGGHTSQGTGSGTWIRSSWFKGSVQGRVRQSHWNRS